MLFYYGFCIVAEQDLGRIMNAKPRQLVTIYITNRELSNKSFESNSSIKIVSR